jgi:peptidyl-prolyl cis-trans isomerase A (cyclophilin A)
MYDIYIAQFGMHGNPAVAKEWKDKRIRDDPVTQSNGRGTLSFAMSGRDTRTTQLFLNFGDSAKVLDADFAPFAKVVTGMNHVDSIHKVGEGPPSGAGPSQAEISENGNAFLDSKFPKLTQIVSVRC